MCLFPQAARLNPEGGRPILDPEGNLRLPCGNCCECLSLRAVDWAVRARHEISLHQDNCFLTLTYDDAHLPSHLCLKEPFQRFIHYLRRREKKKASEISYMVSHEYGSQFFRPHHHCILFGYSPPKQTFLKKSPSGESLFTSDSIASLWPYGFHSIGTANEKTAYYIASYALKGKKHSIVLPNGEIVEVADEFDNSKRPGIGLRFFQKNYKSMIARGDLLPRYYLKKLGDHVVPKKVDGQLVDWFVPGIDQDAFEQYENDRMLNFQNRSAQQRLAKFSIADAKANLCDNEFRLAPDKTSYSNYIKTMLRKEALPEGDL